MVRIEDDMRTIRHRPPVVTGFSTFPFFNGPQRVSRGHSVKPVESHDLVKSLCPAPRYADLFSRYQHNDKWDCHGDEAPLNDPGPLPAALDRTQVPA